MGHSSPFVMSRPGSNLQCVVRCVSEVLSDCCPLVDITTTPASASVSRFNRDKLHTQRYVFLNHSLDASVYGVAPSEEIEALQERFPDENVLRRILPRRTRRPGCLRVGLRSRVRSSYGHM